MSLLQILIFDVTNEVPAWALLIINGGINVFAEQFKCFNVLDDRIKQLEDFKAVNSNITAALQVENSRLNKVVELFEEKLDDYERRNRNQCLLFHGITEAHDKKTDGLIIKVIHNDLDLKDVSLPDVQRSHRVGPKRNLRPTRNSPSKPRPINVRFLNYRVRQQTSCASGREVFPLAGLSICDVF